MMPDISPRPVEVSQTVNLDIDDRPLDEIVGEKLKEWAIDPVQFVIETMGVEPDVWQSVFLTRVSQYDRVSCRSGHGVGKSAAISWLIIWFLLTRYPAKVVVTAPKVDQLRDVIWSEAAIWRRRMPIAIRENLIIQSDTIFVAGLQKENFAVARTARRDVPEGMQGTHSPNQLSIAEEASGVPEDIFEVIEGTMTTRGSKLVLIGNPTRLKGYFYHSFHKDKHRWRRMHVSSEKARMVSPEWIEYMRNKHGEESNSFRVRVLGEFPTEDERAVISLSLAEEARYRQVVDSGLYPVVWGLDVARFGSARSALAKRRGDYQLERVKYWLSKSTTQLAELIIEEYEIVKTKTPKLVPVSINVDIVGLGAGVYDILNDRGLPVVGVNASEGASNKQGFFRKRDELWFACRDWFETQRVSLVLEDEDLVDELTSIWYDVLERGVKKVESKKELASRGHISPDLADSFVLTFASGHDKLYNEMITPSSFKSKRDGYQVQEPRQNWLTI